MDKQRIRYLLLRYWWIPLLTITGSWVGTSAWLQRQPSLYSARAVIEVAQAEERILDVKSVKSENPAGNDYISTVAESLVGAQVLIEAARSIGQYDEMRHSGMIDAPIVESLRGKIKARWRAGTRLIDLNVTDLDPVRAQQLANAVVNKYLDLMGEQRSTISGSASDYLRKQAERLKAELSQARNNVANFRLEHKEVPLEEQTTMLADQMKQITEQRLLIGSSRLRLQEDLKRMNEAKGDMEELLRIGSVSSLPSVNEARSRLLQQETSFETIKQTYLNKHPRYIQANQGVEAARTSLKTLLLESSSLLTSELSNLKIQEEQLAASLATQSTDSQKLANVLIPYQLLKQEAESTEKMYETVTQRVSELGVKDPTGDRSPIYFVEHAMVPVVPIWPDRQALLIRAAMLGLVAGAALLFLIDRLDNSFQSVEQIESELKLPVLAAIPDDRIEKRKGGDLTMADAGGSLQAEAYRTLRTSFSLLGEESQRRAILVTSAVPGEGKSRTSANLAISFAQQGYKTLLIDADLRRPALRRLFTPADDQMKPEASFGLADYLSDLVDASSIIRPSPVENLSLVYAGRKCPQPAEVLSQPATGRFIAAALTHYDRVVIDTAPINSVADTLALVPHVHYVCLVVRSCHTPRREVKRALEFLTRASAKLAGIAMNRIPMRIYGYYYNYKSDPYLNQAEA